MRRRAHGTAIAAHVRHAETRYDEFLACGVDRRDARDRVREQIDHLLARWRSPNR
jgi:hypothetical protein